MEEWRRRRGSGGRRPSPRAALRRKVRKLRRLVPGGEDAPARSLLLRTADYIVRLRARVELLRTLAALYGAPQPQVAGADACMS
ncbi:transcription factor IBH1-like [Phragmites australis]|uniref:transcription factor IBH1-like n=1 Tax=Phragmites australis TaxID=29695 RepID=UPI002D796EF6|nr:transcription factor IBH1-like [Phragmites australis]